MLNKYKRRVQFDIYNIHSLLENPVEGHTNTRIYIIIIIIIMNFNRRNSHGHHGSKHRELAQHAFTRTLTSTQLQPRGAKRQLSFFPPQYAGSVRVSVIHRTT